MSAVSVRELKNRLSEYLRRLEEDGEAITVTRRGKPLAVITPVEPRGDALTRRLRQLAAEGVIQWSGRKEKPRGLKPGIKLRGDGPTAAEIVIQGRE